MCGTLNPMTHSADTTRKLADHYADAGDPNGWFEDYYARAGGKIEAVHWADLAPGPCLTSWCESHPPHPESRAIVVGCGLGDDAEFLAGLDLQVTAFDISPSAIRMCGDRWPDSAVDYRVADLFTLPPEWKHGFDLVYECNTVQALRGNARGQAVSAISSLVAPGGSLLVSCRSRDSEAPEDIMPLPLHPKELHGFVREGLEEIHLHRYDDDQNPPVPHTFAVYRRPFL
jgi:SAM-dependent methyltransferase